MALSEEDKAEIKFLIMETLADIFKTVHPEKEAKKLLDNINWVVGNRFADAGFERQEIIENTKPKE